MEKVSLQEMFSRPTYRADYARAKAGNTCIRCGASALSFRDMSSRLEYIVSALCQQCQDKCFGLNQDGRQLILE